MDSTLNKIFLCYEEHDKKKTCRFIKLLMDWIWIQFDENLIILFY